MVHNVIVELTVDGQVVLFMDLCLSCPHRILLLGRVVWAGEGEGGWEGTPPNKPNSEVSLYSQRIHINSSESK